MKLIVILVHEEYGSEFDIRPQTNQVYSKQCK